MIVNVVFPEDGSPLVMGTGYIDIYYAQWVEHGTFIKHMLYPIFEKRCGEYVWLQHFNRKEYNHDMS